MQSRSDASGRLTLTPLQWGTLCVARAPPISRRLLTPQVLLRVFACRSAMVHEEALLAVGAFNYAAGKQFVKYMESFFPVLLQGLTNHQVGAALYLCSSGLER